MLLQSKLYCLPVIRRDVAAKLVKVKCHTAWPLGKVSQDYALHGQRCWCWCAGCFHALSVSPVAANTTAAKFRQASQINKTALSNSCWQPAQAVKRHAYSMTCAATCRQGLLSSIGHNWPLSLTSQEGGRRGRCERANIRADVQASEECKVCTGPCSTVVAQRTQISTTTSSQAAQCSDL